MTTLTAFAALAVLATGTASAGTGSGALGGLLLAQGEMSGLGAGLGAGLAAGLGVKPEMAGRIFINMILTAALIEGVALFAVIVGVIATGKFPAAVAH
ncbi:MAG: ATP synthase F0 subunit C [Planctomycetota bacterium]